MFQTKDTSVITKKCTKCYEIKSINQYYKDKTKKDKHRGYCKTCSKKYNNKQRKRRTYPISNITEKECVECHKIKPINMFTFSKHDKSGYFYKCKDCLKKYRQKRKELPRKKITEKKCAKCYEIKSVEIFTRSSSSMDGYYSYCRDCHNEMVGIKHNTLKGKISSILGHSKLRSRKISKDHNLTKEFICKLYEKQKGLCAISGMKMEVVSKHEQYSRNPYIISIDRINSLKGYIKDNVQLVCDIVNRMKNELIQDEFLKICNIITDYNK